MTKIFMTFQILFPKIIAKWQLVSYNICTQIHSRGHTLNSNPNPLGHSL